MITRSLEKAVDVWDMDVNNGSWYLVETNYDHWKKPFFLDDRRTPAKNCLNKVTQKVGSVDSTECGSSISENGLIINPYRAGFILGNIISTFSIISQNS